MLTNCDAFENFPPSFFKALVKAAKVPGALKASLAPMRTAAARKSPLGYGMLSHGDVDHLASEWVKPAFADDAVFEDLRRLTVALDSEVTLDAAKRLPGFTKPVLLAWATDDKLFPLADAQRLAKLLPDARVETIADSRAFSMLDQPDRLAELVAEFARPASPSGALVGARIARSNGAAMRLKPRSPRAIAGRALSTSRPPARGERSACSSSVARGDAARDLPSSRSRAPYRGRTWSARDGAADHQGDVACSTAASSAAVRRPVICW